MNAFRQGGGLLQDEQGQMAVELAALLPAMLVVALAVYNLARYAEACAAFDRIALDAVIAHGVAPSGEQSIRSSTAQVASAIQEGLGMASCEVFVETHAARGDGPASGVAFPISPLLTTYVCKLSYSPWPHAVSFGRWRYSPPVRLTHERSLVIDRYRAGVVL